ncbi:MAG: tetratricopeptide repeat-containing sensor histidine kinase [Cyclobacteriaceae bacterium]|nr:tetratricopeptide repeat-containing sensor histidine kinase [Cyclobacteriaceae bacterium]
MKETERISFEQSKLKKKACLLIGFLFYSFLAFSQNLQKADSALQIYESNQQLPDSINQQLLYIIYAEHPVPDSRIKYAQIAYDLAIKTNDLNWKSKSLLNIGQALKSKGDLEKSLNIFFKYLEDAKKEGQDRRIALAYSSIGSVYRVQENFSNALTYYNLAIGKLRELADSTNLATSLMNTGELYRINHILDTALLYFDESGKIFDLKNFALGKAYNLGNVGLVYAEQGKDKLAEEYINDATKILEGLGDQYPIAVYNTYMADIYKDNEDLPKAIMYAYRSYQIAKKDGLKEQIRDASLKLSELYEIAKDYKNAFHYQKQYIEYRDSINNEETIRKMADLRTEYEVSQKQAEVDLLNQRQKTYLSVGGALVLLIMALGSLAFVYHKRNEEKKATNKILEVQKKELELQREELERLNSTKDRFFSIISHDLRGPVNAFKGLSSILKLDLEEGKLDEIPAIVERIETSASQLSFLLNNLLDWAVNQQGQFPFMPEKIELLKLIKDVSAVSQNMADSKEISLNVEIDKDITVLADRNSVRAIVRNLVNNALKFTKNGGSITIAASGSDGKALISISDSGIGIPPEKMKSLFQLNGGKSTVGTRGEKGLGLGLRLVYEFAQMNNGIVSVESREGLGTTFKVLLPLYSSDADDT